MVCFAQPETAFLRIPAHIQGALPSGFKGPCLSTLQCEQVKQQAAARFAAYDWFSRMAKLMARRMNQGKPYIMLTVRGVRQRLVCCQQTIKNALKKAESFLQSGLEIMAALSAAVMAQRLGLI